MTLVFRAAEPDDIPTLITLEKQAAQTFVSAGFADLLGPPPHHGDATFYAPKIADGLCLIAEWEGEPVGFAAGRLFGDVLYLSEVDVIASHGRRGIGRQLIAQLCRRAQLRGATAVVLSTFRAPPWNAPFYRRIGFSALSPDDYTPWMAELAMEQSSAFDMNRRLFMRAPIAEIRRYISENNQVD